MTYLLERLGKLGAVGLALREGGGWNLDATLTFTLSYHSQKVTQVTISLGRADPLRS